MRVAFNGGAVTGLLVVGLALLSVGIFYTLAKNWIGTRARGEKPGRTGAWARV